MKILYITPDIKNSGGIARVVALKANYLVSVLNYKVDILTVNDCDGDFFYPFDSKIQWFTIDKCKNKALFLWRYLQLIKKTIYDQKPDIVIVCDAVLWIFIPWLIKSKTPLVFETHVSVNLKKIQKKGFLNKIRSEIILFLKRITSRKFDKFIVLTERAAKEWKINNSKVIPNPVSFISENQARLQNKKAIAVCRHSYEKGLDRLLLIWKEILKKYPDWILDVYGQWDADLKYQKIAEKMKIAKKINFISPVADIEDCYNQSSVFLMTSRSEAFPMVLLEAMNCGLPSIAYDCSSGPGEIIQNNQNGFLIEDDNIDLFVEKLELLIKDEDLRLELGKNAKKTTEQYEIQLIMNTWIALFEDLKKPS
ncbi:glycosyltransferase family 4 protein [Flavobacterium cheongpyeongense]|uniref:Glycosyltransferase family 4 protein n=1 Tax=Flavobacterium cheongpyeongense TaxID=2212651 RepID=A0A2V4BJG4_9FLAO|nr:glycosyltransferase family 4 protein [Flavobacterium cheongpyeongense]PXY39085.1 glycosyltransferase family 4 protein [Flavobacterium cheongpyeongense]